MHLPILPLAKQVFVNTISQDLVSVTPMGKPLGNIAYMDYTYSVQLSEYAKRLIDKIQSYYIKNKDTFSVESFNEAISIMSRKLTEKDMDNYVTNIWKKIRINKLKEL